MSPREVACTISVNDYPPGVPNNKYSDSARSEEACVFLRKASPTEADGGHMRSVYGAVEAAGGLRTPGLLLSACVPSMVVRIYAMAGRGARRAMPLRGRVAPGTCRAAARRDAMPDTPG